MAADKDVGPTPKVSTAISLSGSADEKGQGGEKRGGFLQPPGKKGGRRGGGVLYSLSKKEELSPPQIEKNGS